MIDVELIDDSIPQSRAKDYDVDNHISSFLNNFNIILIVVSSASIYQWQLV